MLYQTRLVFFFVASSCMLADSWQYQNDNYENTGSNGFTMQLHDILKNLGLLEALNNANAYVSHKINEAQKYDRFLDDWKQLKSEPLNAINIINFVKNTTLPAMVHIGIMLQEGARSVYLEVMSFTRDKCDKFLGSKAALHPWNVIKQNKETVSFLVFVYALCLAIILLKLCSFWNFLGWLTFGYTTYVLAGPYLCFKWLVFFTGVFWYLFDLVLRYPLHMALLFLFCYAWTYLSPGSYFLRRSSKQRFTSIPQTPAAAEFKYLKGKMNQIEDRADEMQKKIAELEIMFKRMEFGKDQ